ncbi:MAG TPA: FAD-binding oxidoreductase [Melioribacteraceae bacterium]|nr:FAD-binding oxidoreductase [Melioribacteraceae bacterium]
MIIKTEPEFIDSYLNDAANFKGRCEAVYIAESIEDIITVVKYCNISNIKLTVSGNRTSLTGAAIPMGGIVLSVEKFNKIKEIDCEGKFIITEPAVMLCDLKEAVKNEGLFYPADPTEQNCYIGSTISTNASGARTYKFGSTRNFVEELKIITPTGDKLNLVRGKIFVEKGNVELITENGNKLNLVIPDINLLLTKNSAGYYCKEGMDVIDLFIGSEGTLGVIYEIKLKLLKLPDKIFSSVVFFDDINTCFNLIEFIKALKDDIIKPMALEFMDKNSINMLKKEYSNIPNNAVACLWIEQDSGNAEYESIINRYIEIFEDFGIDTTTVWFAFSDTELVEFQKFRHAIPSLVNEYITKNNFVKIGTDIAVPDKVFRQFYFECLSNVELSGINYTAYGHFGNSHLHLNMLPKNSDEIVVAKEIYYNLCKLAVNNKGTFSAEHGIGKIKSKFMPLMYNEDTINKFANIKKVLDPNLILNIGNILEEKYLYEV